MFLGLALLLVLAVLAARQGLREQQTSTLGDVSSELSALSLGLEANPYTDPSGLFRMVPPAGWQGQPRGPNSPYNMVYRSPNGPDISILATPVEDDSFQDLLARIDRIERETGIEMNLEIVRFHGFRSARRTANLKGMKVLVIDFATGGVAHHIQFSAHPLLFDQYLPAVLKLLDTYEPLEFVPGDEA